MKTAMIDTGQFEYEIEKNGALIYADYMKRNEPWLANEEQVKEVETFLADKAVEEHAQKEGIIMGHRKYKPTGGTGTGGTKLSAAQKKQMKLTGDIDEVAGEVAKLDTVEDKLKYMNRKSNRKFITGKEVKKQLDEELKEAKMNLIKYKGSGGVDAIPDPDKLDELRDKVDEVLEKYGVDKASDIEEDGIYDEELAFIDTSNYGSFDEFVTDTVMHLEDPTKTAVGSAYAPLTPANQEEFEEAKKTARKGQIIVDPQTGKKWRKN
jgi:hypothetical protein